MSFYARLIGNHPLANITFVVVVLTGAVAYLSMPREQDPEISFNWVDITTILPGASAEDVEKRVTKPLEDALKNVQDVKFVSSSSREGASTILIRFREISERVFDKRINDLRREIQNKAAAELPVEAKEPIITEVTTSNGFPTAMVLVTGASEDEILRGAARTVRDDLERVAGVDRIYASGLHDPELRVEFEPARLASRGLTPGDVADAVGGWFRDTFAGKREAGGQSWLVRVAGAVADPDYLGRLTVSPAADPRQKTALAEIATAERARATPARLVRHAGQPAVLLAITKKSYTNTLELVARINAYLEDRAPILAASGIRLQLLDDQTVPTREAIKVMQSNALLGLTLVLTTCWLFLGTRIAVLTSLGIPFALAGAFATLHALGFTLNITVLLGVVIALGMLVDDAVVIVEAIYYRLERAQAVAAATLDAISEVAAPVISSVSTTVAAFLPLMLLPGIVGKFMFVIPFVVTLALAISLIEAFWILPAHVNAVRPDPAGSGRVRRMRRRLNHWIRVRYSRLLIAVLRRPRLSLGLGVCLIAAAGGMLASGMIRVQFFAFDPIRLFYVNVDMPAGAPLDQTLEQTLRAEARVLRHLRQGEARGVASYAGLKFTETEPLYGDAYGQVIVSLNPARAGMRDVGELVEAMRVDVEATPGLAKTTFTLISGGPPVQKPIRVRVRGEDYPELRAAADAMKAIVASIDGVRDVADDDVPGRPELNLTLDRDAVRSAGLNPAAVARWIRLHVDGEVVATMRDQGEELEVRVRAKRAPTHDIGSILDAPIALAGGGTTTLGALVRTDTGSGRGVVKHFNFRRTITVEADIDKERVNVVEANRSIVARWNETRAAFPGVDIDLSGELEDVEESLQAMQRLFLFGVGLIYLILAAQFRSYWQPLMILVTVPLAFTGVVIGLLVSGNPLSLYTLYGVIALVGIAVNSAIVMISAANERLAGGMSVLHAAVYAARRRVVPILITAVTTIAGLFSLAAGIGGKSLLWGPVASSIVWGLGFSTLLTLFTVPLLYRTFMR